MTASTIASITGQWLGNYTYDGQLRPTSFTATLVDVGGWVSGATEEQCDDGFGATRAFHAMVAGGRSGAAVTFTKTYDGSGGWYHHVRYAGSLAEDGTEIDGRWRLADGSGGTFLMIRATRQEEAVRREVMAKA